VTVVLVGPIPIVLGTEGAARSTRMVSTSRREESSPASETPPIAMHETALSIPSHALPLGVGCVNLRSLVAVIVVERGMVNSAR
jgi:hypothetical protein